MSKMNCKNELDKIYKESESLMAVVKGEKKHAVLVKGSQMDIAELLLYLFESDNELYKIIKAAVNTYEDFKEFKKKGTDEQINILIDELKKVGENLKKVLN